MKEIYHLSMKIINQIKIYQRANVYWDNDLYLNFSVACGEKQFFPSYSFFLSSIECRKQIFTKFEEFIWIEITYSGGDKKCLCFDWRLLC